MEDAESVRAACSATHTALDCTGDLDVGERWPLHPLYILWVNLYLGLQSWKY